MQRLPRYLAGPKSIAGRVKAISQRYQPPVAQSIVHGLENAKRIKLAVKQKVAWQHASPMFVPHASLLEQAIDSRSSSRIHLVLKRMLNEHVKRGKPVGVTPELLEKCMDRLLTVLLSNDPKFVKDAPEAVENIAEIGWRLGHSADAPLWYIASAVAFDIQSDLDRCRDTLSLLKLSGNDIPLLKRVISSPTVSHELLAELHSCISRATVVDLDLATAFYTAAMRHKQQKIPQGIQASIAQLCHAVTQKASSGNIAEDMWRSAVALAHLHISQGKHEQANLILDQLTKLTASAQWPMSASAMAIRLLLSKGKDRDALRTLEFVAARDYAAFVELARKAQEFNDASVRSQLLDDELSIRLQSHTTKSGKPSAPPKTAFFVPSLDQRMASRGVSDSFEKYYEQVERLVAQHFSVDLACSLVSDAGAWSFRTQSPAPMERTAAAIAEYATQLDSSSAQQLLLQYTRALRSIGLIHYVNRKGIPSGKEHQISLTPLFSTETRRCHICYKDALANLRRTQRAILSEYLRRGIDPPAEALAVFSSLMFANNEPRSQTFAARILPCILPEMTGSRHPGRMAAQAYYEQMLTSCSTRPKRLIQLFTHLVGHRSVDSPEFLRRLVDLTVIGYLRHGHIHEFGFFHLEKTFIRFVSRPKFPTQYLNAVRARFWALHMFLRKNKYVPRLKLHRRQFRVHKYRSFEMQATSIPSAAKMKDQKVDVDVVPIKEGDVERAIEIFLTSPVPEYLLGTERYSLEGMLKKQTRIVKPHEEKAADD